LKGESGDPRFRLDLIIATLALLASASASIATVVQTRVVANQLSAAVWPYLNFTTTRSPNSLVVTLDNDGLGPALIGSASLIVDGHPQRRWRDAITILRSKPQRKKFRPVKFSFSEFGIGTVIRPATDFQIFRVDGSDAPLVARETQGHVSLEICYCSILQKCWRMRLESDATPVETKSCGPGAGSVKY
jgi:hypothetical protein